MSYLGVQKQAKSALFLQIDSSDYLSQGVLYIHKHIPQAPMHAARPKRSAITNMAATSLAKAEITAIRFCNYTRTSFPPPPPLLHRHTVILHAIVSNDPYLKQWIKCHEDTVDIGIMLCLFSDLVACFPPASFGKWRTYKA